MEQKYKVHHFLGGLTLNLDHFFFSWMFSYSRRIHLLRKQDAASLKLRTALAFASILFVLLERDPISFQLPLVSPLRICTAETETDNPTTPVLKPTCAWVPAAVQRTNVLVPGALPGGASAA